MTQFYIVILVLAMVSRGSSYNLARQVEQRLTERSTYVGGWPLAAVPCPSDAPVQCSTGISSQINQECCPSGNTCVGWPGIIVPVCCPTSESCIGQLQNIPVCANSSWNLYQLGSESLEQGNYFCCEQGQVGVLPETGYAGICQDAGQASPSSKSATLVNGAGSTTVVSSSSTALTASMTTASKDSSAATLSATSSSNTGTSSSSSHSSKLSKSSALGTGGIAGIAVGGGIVIAALIFVLWRVLSRKRSQDGITTITYNSAPEKSSKSGIPAAYNPNPIMHTQQPQPPAFNANELSGENRRAEIGH